MVHHDVCPLCSSKDIDLKFRCTDHFISGREFPVFGCLSCGFSFTQDYPEEDEIAEYYESEDYISHNDTAKGFSNKLYRIARRIMLRRKLDLVISLTGIRSGTILDIGSGTGHFAVTMKKAGWQVKGIEVSEKAREYSISKFGLEIISPSQVSTLQSASFDCITLWHVLEHFHDPFKYISEIGRMMKPGSFCLIALPNSSSFDAKHYKRFWAAWDVPRHLWHFNPATFRIFCDISGLVLEEIKTLPLDVFYISQMSEKYAGSSIPFIKGIVRGKIFAFSALFNKNRSSSVIYILRKQAV